ncbi:hypothetical protein FACS1894105_06940 [Clostridia bacterium]|nr:hypothetical protein FACS1894105_06940 [Clostridia bacterium]
MSLIEAFQRKIQEKENKQGKYHCVVLFSGGKDSTYLSLIMRQYFGKKVCLFTVNNGYENGIQAQKIASELHLDLFIYQPDFTLIDAMYKYFITNPLLKEIDTNPLCFLCNRFFTRMGLEFAQQNDIPFVINALTSTQIFGTNVVMTERYIKMAYPVMKNKMNHAKGIIMQSADKSNNALYDLLQRICDVSLDDYLLYPFMYYDYNIKEIIRTLEKELGWENPLHKSNEEYVTSGCELTKLFGILETQYGFQTHEQQEMLVEYEKGSLDERAYQAGLEKILSDLSNSQSEITDELLNKLGLSNLTIKGDQ